MILNPSRVILLVGALVLFSGVMLLDRGVAPFILLAALLIFVSIIRLSVPAVFYTLLIIRPSLDIFGAYVFIISSNLPSINIAGIVALISIIVSIILIYRSQKRILTIPLSALFIFLFFIYGIFTVLSLHPIASINELIRVSSFLLMYFTGYVVINTKHDLTRIIWAIIISSIIPTIVGYIQLFNGAGLYTNPGFENRIAGTFGHPNVLGYFLLIIIALIVYLYFENPARKPLYKTLLITYGVLLGVLLLSTYTRGAWIGISLLLLGVSIIRYTKKTLIISAIAIPIMAISAFSYTWVQTNIIYDLTPLEDISVISRVVGLFNGDPSDSIIWRQIMWSDMYNKALTRPIIGFGAGTIEIIVEEVRGVSLGALEAHNDYIKILVEMGVIGLFSYITFILALLYSLLIRIQSKQDTLFLIMTFLVLAIYLSSIWDNLLRQTAVMWIFFGLLGVVMKYHTIRAKDPSKDSPTEE